MPHLYDHAAKMLRDLGNPARIGILQTLRNGEASREALFQAAKLKPPAFAQHLARLRTAGIVRTRRQGKHTYYRIADPRVLEVCDRAARGYKRSYE